MPEAHGWAWMDFDERRELAEEENADELLADTERRTTYIHVHN
jgi:hypothetical protein